MATDSDIIVKFNIKHAGLGDGDYCIMIVQHALNDPFEVSLSTYRSSKIAGAASTRVGHHCFPLDESDLPDEMLAGLSARNKAACEQVLEIWNKKAGSYALNDSTVDV